MIDELFEECGVAALYWLGKSAGRAGPATAMVRDGDVTPLMPAILLDLQNRGQLASGLASYDPDRQQILDTYKDIGTVAEAFRMSHPAKHSAILREYAGRAAIGHTRYATCGLDDVRYAQPFERHHGRLWKWFTFAFNGQLANYVELRDRLLAKEMYHFSLNTDTEIIMHSLAYHLRGEEVPDLVQVMGRMAKSFDGSYNIVFLDGLGRMVVARDPLGFRPLCWAVQGRLFGAASESAALANAGFTNIRSMEPGEMAIIENGVLRLERFAPERPHAHCFFEWVYFSGIASTIDGASVYVARSNLGRRLAEQEDQEIDDSCIVVPVPDTAKPAADAFAYHKRIPCVEGLIRNRYIGRTFIQPDSTRGSSARSKYTPLPSVLKGKRVFLIEDSIVRSTTLRALVGMIRKRGGAKEVHVRVSCPPIVSPCFYGIDMSRLGELFAPAFLPEGYKGAPDARMLANMAKALSVDSLKYLSTDELGPCIGIDGRRLCKGCVLGKYPSKWGNSLACKAMKHPRDSGCGSRTYE